MANIMIICNCRKKYENFNKWLTTCKKCMFGISYFEGERKSIYYKSDNNFVLCYWFKTNLIYRMEIFKNEYLGDSVEDFSCNPSNSAKFMKEYLVKLKENIMFS